MSNRILCIGETWFGSDARACFAAFRRLGHSVQVLDENHFVSHYWRTTTSRGIRKLLKPVFVNELKLEAIRAMSTFNPHCLFIFKGNSVHPAILDQARRRGVISVNYYPDVSFLSHGSYIPRTLRLYDHIFSTKSYGVEDMKSHLGVRQISFLPPGYDPELHNPIELSEEEQRVYGCDVAFIGTWSPKKESLLMALEGVSPSIALKIWGEQWEKSKSSFVQSAVVGTGVTGDEYTKAICGASICLGLLSEKGKGASSGDLITARTFQIPACGTFMLHERNPEVLRYFEDGREAAFFSSPTELVERVRYYLDHVEIRDSIAKEGLNRSLRDEYAIDGRMKVILGWLDQQRNSTGR